MDDKNLQNESITPVEPALEEIPVPEETVEAEAAAVAEEADIQEEAAPEVVKAEVVDTTVMPKVEFTGYVQNETVITIKKEEKKNGFAIASMVCGIVGAVFAFLGICGLCCCCWPITMPASICAIIFAFVDRSRKNAFCGMTIAGLICGIFGVIIPIAVLIFQFFLNFGGNFSVFIDEFLDTYYDSYEQFQ